MSKFAAMLSIRRRRMRAKMSFFRRLLGFAGLPFLSLIAPFILLPLIARIGGAEGWASVAIGQSVGAFAAICISFGWGLTGPSDVAAAPDSDRARIYAVSFAARVVLFVLIAPAACFLTWVLVPEGYKAEGVAMTATLALGGLSPAWYCVGIGRPSLIAIFEVVPRLCATGLAAFLLVSTHSIFLYPTVMAAGTLVGLLVFNSRQLSPSSGRFPIREGIRTLGRQRHAAAAGLISGAYSSTPVSIVGAFAETQAVAAFASGEKLYRLGLYAVMALGNTFQGWVAESRGNSTVRRMKLAVTSHAALGLIGMASLGFLGPVTSGLLFGSEVQATGVVCWGYGLAFFAVSLTTALGKHVLVPLGQTKIVLQSTVLGASIGVPALAILAAAPGGGGGSWGLAIGELCVCLFQLSIIARKFNEFKDSAGLPLPTASW